MKLQLLDHLLAFTHIASFTIFLTLIYEKYIFMEVFVFL